MIVRTRVRKRSGRVSRLVIICGLHAILAPAAYAAEYTRSPETYIGALASLSAGDRLRLAPGIYRDGLPIRNRHGEPARPIVIEGPSSGPPAVLLARAGHNTISLRQSSHLVIRNLLIDGANVGVDAIKAEWDGGLVHHITLEGLTIIGHGIDQGVNGISTKTPAAFWTIRNNVIIGAGTGMYLGNSDGNAPFIAGVIEGNLVVDTVGYNVQIKHQRGRPALEGLPGTAQRTVIRGNFFSKAENASAGQMARPNLLLGHFPLEGPGSNDEYLVTENVFYANPVESLLQAEGNVVIDWNVFINPVGNAVSIQPHNDLPRHIEITHNFILAAGYGIRLQGAAPGYTQLVSANREFTGTATQGNNPAPPVVSTEEEQIAFREWLKLAPTSDGRGVQRAIVAALRMACARDRGTSPPPPGLIPQTHFVCQRL